MDYLKGCSNKTDTKEIKASDIAEFLDGVLIGKDIKIVQIVAIDDIKPKSLCFINKYKDEYLNKLNQMKDIVVICSGEYSDKLECSYIVSVNPRLDFLRVVQGFFYKNNVHVIHPTAIISPGAAVGENVSIGAHTYIGSQVRIGNNTAIHHNVIIDGKVDIGENCIIKAGAVIGEEGFGFEYNEQGIPEHFPHIGAIQIGVNVFIGANTTIERATIGCTIIEDNVKIDDLVQIGHNTRTEKNTLIMAGVVLCGGAKIGKNCWIAPNSTIKQKVKIFDNVVVGLGSVIIRDVPVNQVVAGVPAREITKLSQ